MGGKSHGYKAWIGLHDQGERVQLGWLSKCFMSKQEISWRLAVERMLKAVGGGLCAGMKKSN